MTRRTWAVLIAAYTTMPLAIPLTHVSLRRRQRHRVPCTGV